MAKTVRIAVDACMATAYVAVMACALVQEAPHEYLGMALFALVAAHVVMHRRWLASLARGRYGASLALTLSQYASVAVLVAGMFHYVARFLRGHKAGSKDHSGGRKG